MSKTIRFTPNIKQWQAMTAKQLYIGYGGARGGGKSHFVRMKAIVLALNWPGISICIVRSTFDELDKNHIIPLKKMLDAMGIRYRYNDSKHTFFFPKGSTIKMDYFFLDKHANHFQGIEYDVIFLDEATNFKEEWLTTYFQPCVRGVNGFPKHIYYTCNPGGVGHGYIKRVFIDRDFLPFENPDDYTFIQAKVTDNVALMKAQPRYIHQLEQLPPAKRAAWLDGDWNVFEGQVFEEFRNDPEHYDDHRFTHVINPFRIPDYWPIYRSFDWGSAKPFSVGWWAEDTQGTLYRINELYGVQKYNGVTQPDKGVKWTNDQIFSKIYEIEHSHPLLKGKQIVGSPADYAIFDDNPSGGPSIAEDAVKFGIYWDRCDKNRVLGWQQVHARLHFDEDGYAKMYFFNVCKDAIRTLPLMQYDPHDHEDCDSHLEDHAPDEIRYMCMWRTIPALEPEEPEYEPRYCSDPLNQFT